MTSTDPIPTECSGTPPAADTTWAEGEDSYTELPVDAVGADEERIYVASQWQLMWWKFRRHKMAMVSIVLL
ncbi:MAG: hypothetical protein MUP44_08645, partial [Anaerolineales bacterium]|nr:hypothetical protein [Anaerolineales bacterium]